MASKLKFMLPYFSFIVKYFRRGNSGVMPDYFYHDINKIEVTHTVVSHIYLYAYDRAKTLSFISLIRPKNTEFENESNV